MAVSITLNFPDFRTAVTELAKIAGVITSVDPEAAEPVKAPAKKSVVESTPAQVKTAPVEPTVESPSDEASPEITYDVVSKAVLAKMKTDKAAVMAAAAKFKVKNAKELKPEQYADFLKEIA